MNNPFKNLLRKRARSRRLNQAPSRTAYQPEAPNPTAPSFSTDRQGRVTRERDTNFFTALPHPNPARPINDVDLLAEVTSFIDSLYTAGALDHGSYDVLDHRLDAQENTLLQEAQVSEQARVSRKWRFQLTEEAHATELWEELVQAREAHEMARSERDNAFTKLTGRILHRAPRETRTAPIPLPAPGEAVANLHLATSHTTQPTDTAAPSAHAQETTPALTEDHSPVHAIPPTTTPQPPLAAPQPLPAEGIANIGSTNNENPEEKSA